MKVTTSDTVEVTKGRDLEIHDVQDIINEARRHGSHYFGPEEKRFFGSKVAPQVTYHGGMFFFVESSKPPHGPRFYRVLAWRPAAPRDFDRVRFEGTPESEYGGTKFDSLRKAQTALKHLVQGVVEAVAS